MNQDHLENTSGAVCLYRIENDNPALGQYVDTLKTSIINDLAFKVCEAL
jgi:hypothetical protein